MYTDNGASWRFCVCTYMRAAWINICLKAYGMRGFCQQRYNALADNTRRKSLGSWVPGYTLELAPPSLLVVRGHS